MTSARKTLLLIVGFVAALLIVGQFVLGQLILAGGENVQKTIKSHQHSGYATVVVALVYIVLSLSVIASIPTKPKG